MDQVAGVLDLATRALLGLTAVELLGGGRPALQAFLGQFPELTRQGLRLGFPHTFDRFHATLGPCPAANLPDGATSFLGEDLRRLVAALPGQARLVLGWSPGGQTAGVIVAGDLADPHLDALGLPPPARARLDLAAQLLLRPPLVEVGFTRDLTGGPPLVSVGYLLPPAAGRVETLALHRIARGFEVGEPGSHFVRRYTQLLGGNTARPAVCRLLLQESRPRGLELTYGRPSQEAVFLAPLQEFAGWGPAEAGRLGVLAGTLQAEGPVELVARLGCGEAPELWLGYPVAEVADGA